MAGRGKELALRRLQGVLEKLNNQTMAYEIVVQICKVAKPERSHDDVFRKFEELREKEKKKLLDLERGQVWERIRGVTIPQQKEIVAQLSAVEGRIKGGSMDAAILDLQDKVKDNQAEATELLKIIADLE